MATAGAQVCRSASVEIIAPADHDQEVFQSVAVIGGPSSVNSV